MTEQWGIGKKPSISATLWGLVGLLLWSTTIAINSSLVGKIGPFLSVAIPCCISGIVLFLIEAFYTRSFSKPFLLPKSFLLKGGLCFLTYFAFLNLAFSVSPSHETDVLLGLINYLWPSLLLLFSIPLQHNRARWRLLLPGVILGISGSALATMKGVDSTGILSGFLQAPLAFGLMFVAAISWALYSNFVRALPVYGLFGGLPLFMLLTSGVLFLVQLGIGPCPVWNIEAICLTLYIAIGPTLLGYMFWQRGMSRGNHILLAALSYLLPASSTIFTGWYLNVTLTWPVITGCTLLILGAVLSKLGVQQK